MRIENRSRDMRWRWMLLPAFLLALGAATAHPAPEPGSAEVLLLDERESGRELHLVEAVFIAAHPGNLELAATGQLSFRTMDLRKALPFANDQELWIRLRLRSPQSSPASWHLEVPLPVIDSVTTFEHVDGGWRERNAGDTHPMSAWPQPGRYPIFELQVTPGAATELYVRVRHSLASSIPLRMSGGAGNHQAMQLEYLALGLLLGALGVLMAAGAGSAVWLRDATYGWYASYALVALLATAAFTGVAGHLLWGSHASWADAAPGSLTLAAGALAMAIGHRLTPVVRSTRWLRAALRLATASGLVFAISFAVVARPVGIAMVAAHLLAVTTLSTVVALLIRERQERVGTWLLVAAVPLCVTVLVAAGRAFGLLPAGWIVEYAVVGALALNLPALLLALNSRSEERRGAELRRRASDSQDPLTGLLKSESFAAKLRQAVDRCRHRGEDAAVAVIEVRNYAAIKEQFGAEAAEEALLHAVIKLRRLVRDVDVTGRLAENRFGLILEGVSVRQPMSSLGPRLIAAGLIRDRGQRSAVQFHMVATLISEQGGSAAELLAALEGRLQQMSPRTKRPFRHLPGAGALDIDSQLTSDPETAASPLTTS